MKVLEINMAIKRSPYANIKKYFFDLTFPFFLCILLDSFIRCYCSIGNSVKIGNGPAAVIGDERCDKCHWI